MGPKPNNLIRAHLRPFSLNNQKLSHFNVQEDFSGIFIYTPKFDETLKPRDSGGCLETLKNLTTIALDLLKLLRFLNFIHCRELTYGRRKNTLLLSREDGHHLLH